MREVRRKNKRSSGVAQGQFWYTGNRRAVRGFSIEAPRCHMRVERGLEGRNQALKLLESEAGHIQGLRGARLHIDTPQTGHKGYLLFLEVQYTTNRDKLKCLSSEQNHARTARSPLLSPPAWHATSRETSP